MAFMEPQIVFGQWYEVDGPAGTEFIPADLVGTVETFEQGKSPVPSPLRDYCENREAWSVKLIEGYGARLSAPGYLDCTHWCVFETEEEAKDYLTETYGDEDDEPDKPEEGDYTTEDHIHWYQHGKLVLTTADKDDTHSCADDYLAQLKAHMDAEQFWPNVWLISDHGNAHRIDIS